MALNLPQNQFDIIEYESLQFNSFSSEITIEDP